MGRSASKKKGKKTQNIADVKEQPEEKTKEKVIQPRKSLFRRPLLHILIIVIICLLSYSNTFDVPFHFDDKPNIVDNAKIKDINNFWKGFK